MNEVDMAVTLSQFGNHYGVVKSFKSGDVNKGIRFSKHDFPVVFLILG